MARVKVNSESVARGAKWMIEKRKSGLHTITKRGELLWRCLIASRMRGSAEDEEVILSTRTMSMAQIKRSFSRRVMSALSEEVLGSGRWERASVAPIAMPGV